MGQTLISLSQSGSALSIRHDHPAFNLRDTEVPAKVGKVERANGPGNYDKVELIRPGEKNCDAADRVILPTNPEVAHTWAPVLLTVVHQLLPARRVVLLLHGVQNLRVVRPGIRKMVSVDRDPADACNHPAEVFVVRVQLGRKYQHRMVQRELGFRGRALPQSFDTLRNPVVLLRLG